VTGSLRKPHPVWLNHQERAAVNIYTIYPLCLAVLFLPFASLKTHEIERDGINTATILCPVVETLLWEVFSWTYNTVINLSPTLLASCCAVNLQILDNQPYKNFPVLRSQCVLYDHLCGLVVRLPGYRLRSPGFDFRRCHNF
jgi:hypothetical protein